jgi:hypothetical protein
LRKHFQFHVVWGDLFGDVRQKDKNCPAKVIPNVEGKKFSKIYVGGGE